MGRLSHQRETVRTEPAKIGSCPSQLPSDDASQLGDLPKPSLYCQPRRIGAGLPKVPLEANFDLQRCLSLDCSTLDNCKSPSLARPRANGRRCWVKASPIARSIVQLERDRATASAERARSIPICLACWFTRHFAPSSCRAASLVRPCDATGFRSLLCSRSFRTGVGSARCRTPRARRGLASASTPRSRSACAKRWRQTSKSAFLGLNRIPSEPNALTVRCTCGCPPSSCKANTYGNRSPNTSAAKARAASCSRIAFVPFGMLNTTDRDNGRSFLPPGSIAASISQAAARALVCARPSSRSPSTPSRVSLPLRLT